MTQIDLDGRRFIPVENAASGTVNADTQFLFSQTGQDFSAEYEGGAITHGHILGRFTDSHQADLVYHCLTIEGELKAGQAVAQFSQQPDGRLQIDMDWQWLNGEGRGSSRYKEIS